MFNMITLPCKDVKQTLQQLRYVFLCVYSAHFYKLRDEAKAISTTLNTAAITSRLKESYQGPGFDEEESYLLAWKDLAGSDLSAEEYLACHAQTLSIGERDDAKEYLLAIQTQQRVLKEVNFIAVNTGNQIAGFIIYHILEKDDEVFFQVRQSAMSHDLIMQLVPVLMAKHPYAIFEANKANANTLPVLNALRDAQLAAAQAMLSSYACDRYFKNGMTLFKTNNQDSAYPNPPNNVATAYRPFNNVR
ncbi:MAG: hypothetical protein V4501_05680 [Pseudomonadota bacterium]